MTGDNGRSEQVLGAGAGCGNEQAPSPPGTSTQHPEPPPGYRPVTLEEACRRLNLTDKPLKERIRRGELYGRKIPMKGGAQWRIWLPEEAAISDQRSAISGEETGGGGSGEVLLPESLPELIADRRSLTAAFQDLLHRHEQAMVQLGRRIEQSERLPALEGSLVEAREGERRSREALEAREATLKRLVRRVQWLAITAAVLAVLLIAAAALLLLR
jgi:hypothetical protein